MQLKDRVVVGGKEGINVVADNVKREVLRNRPRSGTAVVKVTCQSPDRAPYDHD